MSVSLRIQFVLLASLLGASPSHAATQRMQDVVVLLGIDEKSGDQAAKDTKAAVGRLVERGLRTHPDIKVREAQLQASRAYVDAAQGRYQPTLRLNADAMQRHSKNMDDDQTSRNDSQGASIVLQENLWRGGRDAGEVDLAKQNESLAEIRKSFEGEGLVLQLSRAAFTYNYRFFRHLIDEASLTDAVELRSLAERKFNAGQVGRIDLHLSSMRESAARAAAARAAIQTQQAYHDLVYLLGPENIAEYKQDIQALTQAALPVPRTLPDLKAPTAPTLNEQNSLALQKRAEINLDQNYRARFMPQIDLIGTVGRQNTSSWLLDNEDAKAISKNSGTTLQLQFSWNIWDRTQDHLIRAAAAEKTAATSALEATRNIASVETERLRTYIQDLHKTLGISREAWLQAGQLYDAQRKLYESGVIGLQPVMDAEREKRDAIRAWQDNVHELQLSLLRWQALQKGYLSSGSLAANNDSDRE